MKHGLGVQIGILGRGTVCITVRNITIMYISRSEVSNYIASARISSTVEIQSAVPLRLPFVDFSSFFDTFAVHPALTSQV